MEARKWHEILSLFFNQILCGGISHPCEKVWVRTNGLKGKIEKKRKLQPLFKVCLDAKQQVQANNCRSMWPGNLTAGSSIWSPQHRPPQINSPCRIQRGGEERLRGGGGGGCMWMVRTSTIRKSEVGSFLRLCRELTLAEGPPSLFSLFVFLSSFSLTICCKLPEG